MYNDYSLALLIRDEAGLATVEYAVLLAGLIIGSTAIWQIMVGAMTTPTAQAAETVNCN